MLKKKKKCSEKTVWSIRLWIKLNIVAYMFFIKKNVFFFFLQACMRVNASYCKLFQSQSYMKRVQKLWLINVLHVRTDLLVIKLGKRKHRFISMKIKNENQNGFILSVVKIGCLTLIQSYVSIVLKKNL